RPSPNRNGGVKRPTAVARDGMASPCTPRAWSRGVAWLRILTPPSSRNGSHAAGAVKRVALTTRSNPDVPPLAGRVWHALHWFSLKVGPRPSGGVYTLSN